MIAYAFALIQFTTWFASVPCIAIFMSFFDMMIVRQLTTFVVFSTIAQLCSSYDSDEQSHLRRELQNTDGQSCLRDADCIGYCVLTKCWNGTENDRCLRNSQCGDTLVCRLAGQAKGQRCLPKLTKGRLCSRDSECIGYCQNLRCWDGAEDDHCGRTSDCQDDLTCRRRGLSIWKKCTPS